MLSKYKAKYYDTTKKRKASKKYQNLSIIENEKKQQYSCEYYKNLSDNEKQKLVEYRKKKILE